MKAAVLLVGTADTKSDELNFLRQQIASAGANIVLMDVGVLAQGHVQVDITNDTVAQAAGTSLAQLRASGDENAAMTAMAQGASRLAQELYRAGTIASLLVLGGTMGTDLAFDVANALPLGVPKFVVSTVAFSHLIAPDRIAPDLTMMLWAGGLYGLNSLCKSTLAQAAGAVVGAMNQASARTANRPLIGMTSLGKSCLDYMVRLKPALEQRGFEVAVFHTTGMGGRAFEAMAAQGQFAAVLDLSLQELANDCAGSVVTAGPSRLTGAGASATPQIVAPGACDMVDFAAWQEAPANLIGQAVHVHNRLIASATAPSALRDKIADTLLERLRSARGPSCLLLPKAGIQAWDKPGQAMHAPRELQAFLHRLHTGAASISNAEFSCLMHAGHINDASFSDLVLHQLDQWCAQGKVRL
jgi:uncharacterized protein (UPF0261 family)